MFNPLLQDLTTLKNEDVDNKITELMQKYMIAARSGQGGVCNQIGVILEAYKDEQRRRTLLATQKASQSSRNLDDYINIDR